MTNRHAQQQSGGTSRQTRRVGRDRGEPTFLAGLLTAIAISLRGWRPDPRSATKQRDQPSPPRRLLARKRCLPSGG